MQQHCSGAAGLGEMRAIALTWSNLALFSEHVFAWSVCAGHGTWIEPLTGSPSSLTVWSNASLDFKLNLSGSHFSKALSPSKESSLDHQEQAGGAGV